MPRSKNHSNNNNASSSSGSGSAGSANTVSTSASSFEADPQFSGNDYCDHYLRTGSLPQSHIRNIEDPLIGYPKLQRLHQLKASHNKKHAGKAYGKRVEPKHMVEELNSWNCVSSGGMNFDVVIVGACVDRVPSYETLVNLPIQRLTPRPSIVLLWLPEFQLEMGRRILEHWGFRRSEDIMYFTADQSSVFYPPSRPRSPDTVTKSSWHCLMGLKGTLRRSEDSDLINCNVDTDVIVEPQNARANIIPEQIYSIIENFSLMNRRLHIVPAHTSQLKPVRPRAGWVIVSPDIMLDNFAPHGYAAESKSSGHRVPVNQDIENLRPKTPPKMKRNKV